MNSVRTIEVLADHWAMKANEAGDAIEISRKRSHVAVAAEDLRISRDQIEIQMRQEVVRPISTTGTDDSFDFGRAKHLVQFIDAAPYPTGEIEFTIEDALGIERIKTQRAQSFSSSLEVFALHRPCRRNDPHGVP